ncbi:50S ribosomal protein L21 [Patescibacteria group bacterium]|nr:50S ribosomal protein L21 [Patescibacteria group bacterium]MBU1682652.1 50S ribosomal protein L21 [Patescibacteria group bacterium]MBU1935646.1 50S ribosomal protein L21 [Patescibacteria group bacterium]
MFAIVEIAGKQFKVSKGDTVEVPKLKNNKEGDKVKIDKVLLKSDGKTTDIGTPYVSASSVEITVKKHGKGEKIRVFKKKPKKRFEKTQGHRQQHTIIEVMAVK